MPCSRVFVSRLVEKSVPTRLMLSSSFSPKLTPMVEVKRGVELLGPIPTRGGQLLPSYSVYSVETRADIVGEASLRLSAVGEPPIGSGHPLRRRT